MFGLDDICVRWRKTWWEHGGDMVDMVFNRKCQKVSFGINITNMKNEFWNKNSKNMLYLIHEQMFFGVNITTHQELVRIVNFFEKYYFLGQKCKLFRKYHFWGQKCKLVCKLLG